MISDPLNRDRETHRVTLLLQEAADGKDGAFDELVPLVYDQLRRIAQKRMEGERKGHTLRSTELVHEAYFRLLGGLEAGDFTNRAHFYSAAAEAMRRLVIEHARRRGRLKRGGTRRRVPLNVVDLASDDNSQGILAVDEAIRRLEEEDPPLGRVVRMRFFAGLSVKETAEVLGVSERTVMRDWSFARAWLYQALNESDEPIG